MTIKLPFAGICLAALAALAAGCGKSPDGDAAADDSGSANFARGEAALANNDLATASVEFAAAAQKCETNFEARINLAIIGLRLGNVDEAARAAAEAKTLCPDSAEALLVDGQAAYLQQDYPRAIADFNVVARESSLPAEMRSEALSSRAVVEIAMEDYDAARITLFNALRLNPKNAAAHYHLGYVYRDKYHFDDAALDRFTAAAGQMAAGDERAQKLRREVIPALLGKLQQETASSPGAKDRKPSEAAKLIAEGNDLRARKRITNAIKKFEAALKADPFSSEAALKYADLLSQNLPKGATERKKAAEKILGAYRVAIEGRPSNQSTYMKAAQLAYNCEMWSTAAMFMDRALSYSHENVKALDLLVASLRKAGKKKEAAMWDAYRKSLK